MDNKPDTNIEHNDVLSNRENSRKYRFIKLLTEIFEIDKSDLDFGIYRLLKIRKNKIENYFTTELPQRITEILEPFASEGENDLRRELKAIEESARENVGMEIDQLPERSPLAVKYREVKEKLAAGIDLAALESDVYSALYNFFSRYYDDGDFISKRRYKEGVYAIPYEGEEVKLYWANQDQYYIKTSDNFKDYTFQAPDNVTVHFQIVEATQERDNNQEAKDSKRTFMLYTEREEQPELKPIEYDAEKRDLTIRFVYDIPKEKKVKYAEQNYQQMMHPPKAAIAGEQGCFLLICKLAIVPLG